MKKWPYLLTLIAFLIIGLFALFILRWPEAQKDKVDKKEVKLQVQENVVNHDGAEKAITYQDTWVDFYITKFPASFITGGQIFNDGNYDEYYYFEINDVNNERILVMENKLWSHAAALNSGDTDIKIDGRDALQSWGEIEWGPAKSKVYYIEFDFESPEHWQIINVIIRKDYADWFMENFKFGKAPEDTNIISGSRPYTGDVPVDLHLDENRILVTWLVSEEEHPQYGTVKNIYLHLMNIDNPPGKQEKIIPVKIIKGETSIKDITSGKDLQKGDELVLNTWPQGQTGLQVDYIAKIENNILKIYRNDLDEVPEEIAESPDYRRPEPELLFEMNVPVGPNVQIYYPPADNPSGD